LLVTLVVVSKVNFGPLIEQSESNNQQEKQNYNEIDKIIINFLQKLQLNKVKIGEEQLKEYSINDKFDGGLGLVLPGAYYDVMKQF